MALWFLWHSETKFCPGSWIWSNIVNVEFSMVYSCVLAWMYSQALVVIRPQITCLLICFRDQMSWCPDITKYGILPLFNRILWFHSEFNRNSWSSGSRVWPHTFWQLFSLTLPFMSMGWKYDGNIRERKMVCVTKQSYRHGDVKE